MVEQMEMELGNFRVLQAIKKSRDARNKEARKTFFRWVKIRFGKGKNVNR